MTAWVSFEEAKDEIWFDLLRHSLFNTPTLFTVRASAVCVRGKKCRYLSDNSKQPMATLDFPAPPPLPNPVPFDYFQHEYWRLGQMYRELSQWQLELERWEQDLMVRSRGRPPKQHQRAQRGGRTNAPPVAPIAPLTAAPVPAPTPTV